LAAPQGDYVATLISIVYKPKGAPLVEQGYTRVPLREAQLVAGCGIAVDAKGGAPERSLNIMSLETLRKLAEEGFATAPGEMGEQLVLSGLDIDAMESGARLRIGPSAVVEIVKPRTGCAKLERHQGKLRGEAAGRLGMMARVIAGGPIAAGDTVTVASPEPSLFDAGEV
jgi:MOSC domain-containing protein YiiM